MSFQSNLPIIGAVLAFGFSGPLARADIRFGPVLAGAGQSVRVTTHTTTLNGTIQVETDGRVSNGKIQYSRDRDLTWTFRDPSSNGDLRGMVSVAKITTLSTATIDGKTENSDESSPLNGKMFGMSKPVNGDWKFELDGSVPMRQVDKEISELSVYLKRKWYPQRSVNPGESWEFDPAWIRMLIERDLANSQTIGTMNLRQIRHTTAGDSAVINVSIRSTGGDFRSDGTESAAQIELSGEMVVDLKTMLDESLDLKGTVVSRTGKPGNSRTVTLPVHLEVFKKLVNN